MSGKISSEWGINQHFCKCGFSCRSYQVWEKHKKECGILGIEAKSRRGRER